MAKRGTGVLNENKKTRNTRNRSKAGESEVTGNKRLDILLLLHNSAD